MAITNGYVDLPTLKSHLSITDADDDSLLEDAIEAASRKIDGHCGRRFWQDPADVTRYFTPRSLHTLRLGPHIETADVATVTSVTADLYGRNSFTETFTEGTHYILGPRGNPDGIFWRLDIIRGSGRYWPAGLDGSVKIVGTFGIDGAPDDVAEACVIQAAKVFQVAKDGGGGFSSFATEGGSLGSLYLERSAHMLLDRHVHPLRRLQVG